MTNMDYVSLIEREDIRPFVANFFEDSLISKIPSNEILSLISYINKDIETKNFDLVYGSQYKKTISSYNTMNENQLNSNTHKMFLSIIRKYFGNSAFEYLSERKNLNIFNLSEIQVLNQKIFDIYGKDFVNRIINTDLRPQSLILIRDILSDEKMNKDFEYLYNFYENNIGFSQVNFEKMVRGWVTYKGLIQELRTSKISLSVKQKNALMEIFKDVDNEYSIFNIKALEDFYNIKNNDYIANKNIALSKYKNKDYAAATEILTKAFFKNFYGMDTEKYGENDYQISNNNPKILKKYFDLDDILLNEELKNNFTREEIELLKDLMKVLEANENQNFDLILKYCDKYENKGNELSLAGYGLLDKISKTFARNMIESLSTVEDLDKRARSEEKGIYIDLGARTYEGKEIDSPVYVLEGANFNFLSTTNFANGISGNQIKSDLVDSWFTYENGTTHISASYSTNEAMSNMEFHIAPYQLEGGITYLFDDAEIFSMGPGDVLSPEESRYSDVYSNDKTKFISAKKMEMQSKQLDYNEIVINRFNYNKKLGATSKIIPSAILCKGKIYEDHRVVAELFTKYCVERGLKPKGWKMPIVVVNRKVYREINNMKVRKIISKNSEYFLHNEVSEKEKINKVDLLKNVNR